MGKRSVVERFVILLVFVTGLALVSVTLLAPFSHAATAQEINTAVQTTLTLFSEKVEGGNDLLKIAKGVVVIPNIIKAGLGIGGQYGEGALLIGGQSVDYYSLSAVSVGLQIGAQKHHLILIFKEEALKKFRSNSGWKAGADGSVAFIDSGAGGSADLTNPKAPVVAFVFGQKGLMATAAIEGAKFTKVVR